jgi:FkbM family methyltransferase
MTSATSQKAASEPWWLAATSGIVRRLPRGRYRAMNAVARSVRVPAFSAPFPRSGGKLFFECDLRNSLAREVYFTGQYEPQETALLEALIKRGQTFVDVGAHWGYFTLIASQRVGPTGRVLSIEADPRLFHTLSRNVRSNELAQVDPIRVAAAAEAGLLQMSGYKERDDNWGVSRLVGPAGAIGDPDVFEVSADSIDSLLDQRNIGQVDVLKMDIEGAEALALRGMEKGLRAGRYKTMIVELHPSVLQDFGSSVAALGSFLADCGYRGWRIDHATRATRRSAYHAVSPRELLTPWTDGSAQDAWPHVLWALTELDF